LWGGLVGGEPCAAPSPPAATGEDDDVLSPCTGVCVLRQEGWCTGCGRTVAQIAGWTTLDSDARRLVCADAAVRLGRG
jgi:uncharacterized protein